MVASENTFFSTLSLQGESKTTWQISTIMMSSTFSFNKSDKSADFFLTHSVIFSGYIFVVTCRVISSNIA